MGAAGIIVSKNIVTRDKAVPGICNVSKSSLAQLTVAGCSKAGWRNTVHHRAGWEGKGQEALAQWGTLLPRYLQA